jgi:hypothetical protein
MNWCDPCAADPLSSEELRQLGVFWADDGGGVRAVPPGVPGPFRPRVVPAAGSADVFLTRLHVRYDNAHFPEDLVFQETADRENFQGRYVLRHAWTGQDTCQAAVSYRRNLRDRREQEVQRLASLTGWNVAELRRKAGLGQDGDAQTVPAAWWERLWKK